MNKGLVDSIVLGVLVVITCFVILLVLPNILWIWTRFAQGACKFDPSHLFFGCPQAPVTLETVIKPEYIPLTADHMLFTLLSSNDSSTGLQIQELLALSASQVSDTIILNGNSYNVTQIVQGKLDFLRSDFNYNFVVYSNPQIQIGKSDITPQFFSTSSITLPDLSKDKVELILG